VTALNLQKGQDYEAFVNYERAIELDPLNEDIYCNRAQVSNNTLDSQKATKKINKTKKTFKVLAMKGRFDECFKDFDKSIEINSYHKIAKLQKAFFQFRKFYTEKMQETEMNNNPASLKAKLDEETRKLGLLVESFNEIPEASSLYAQILSEQEKYEDAEKYYEIALNKDPNNAALIVQRALNLMQLRNESEEAIDMLNSAIKADETCEFAYEALATVEIQRLAR
jgi:import receptor subunit TOM70